MRLTRKIFFRRELRAESRHKLVPKWELLDSARCDLVVFNLQFRLELLGRDFNNFSLLQDVQRQPSPGMVDPQFPDRVLQGDLSAIPNGGSRTSSRVSPVMTHHATHLLYRSKSTTRNPSSLWDAIALQTSAEMGTLEEILDESGYTQEGNGSHGPEFVSLDRVVANVS